MCAVTSIVNTNDDVQVKYYLTHICGATGRNETWPGHAVRVRHVVGRIVRDRPCWDWPTQSVAGTRYGEGVSDAAARIQVEVTEIAEVLARQQNRSLVEVWEEALSLHRVRYENEPLNAGDQPRGEQP